MTALRSLTVHVAALLALLGASARAQAGPGSSPLAAEAVQLARARGWLQGYPDGSFRPEQAVTRAELVATALRLGMLPASATRRCFADVPAGAWYAGAVCRARAAGLVEGFADGSFRPEQPSSAAVGLAVLLRASGAQGAALAEELSADLGLEAPGDAAAPLTRGALSFLLFDLERARAREQGRPLPSRGCGQPPATLASVTVDGLARGLIVSLPEPYDPAQPYPLVLAFHGRTSTNAEVQRYYGLERSGVPAIYVYPAAVPSGSGSSWSADESGGLDFFDQLLETLLATYCADLTRIFAVGHSLGASYVNTLACARGEVLRGAAALAGGRPYGACRGRVAAMVIHNPADTLVPVEESEAARERFVAQNGLPDTAVPSEPAFLNCQRYGGPTEPFPVLWCPHQISRGPGGSDYPHTWPRGTGEAIMAFFAGLP